MAKKASGNDYFKSNFTPKPKPTKISNKKLDKLPSYGEILKAEKEERKPKKEKKNMEPVDGLKEFKARKASGAYDQKPSYDGDTSRRTSRSGVNPDRKKPYGKDNDTKREYKPREDKFGGDSRSARGGDSSYQKREYKPREDKFGGDSRSARAGDSTYPKREYKPREDKFSGDSRSARGGDSSYPKREYKPREDKFGGDSRSTRGDDSSYPKREYKPREDKFGGDSRSPRSSDSSYPKREYKPREDKFGGDSRSPRSSDSSYPKREYKPRDSKYENDNRSFGERPLSRKPMGKSKKDDGVIDTYINDVPSSRNIYNKRKEKSDELSSEQMPLNKFLARCGVSSRRDSAEIIKDGRVTVNGKKETEPAYKVNETDIVEIDGRKLTPTNNLVYVLLNKPKDFITTTDDESGRKTVMDLVASASDERIYPIGRLDRNTTGLLLLTNDGDLAQKLSHPKYEIKKLYQVNLDKDLSKEDFESILAGFTLDDGEVQVDELAYSDASDKTKIGIQIHSGKNRIVRRIFESLGYEVKQLDRVMYANLTKKNLSRGTWRYLTAQEIKFLKFYNS
jgi:23S rRNA pseudouridine2605 synthase